MLVETIAQSFCLLVVFFDERVDVVLTVGAIEAASIERVVKTRAETIGLLFDPLDDSFDIFVA